MFGGLGGFGGVGFPGASYVSSGREEAPSFDENLSFYNTGYDQPRMWGGGRVPMRSGEFFAPTFATRNQAIGGWLDELTNPFDEVGTFGVLSSNLGLDPTSLPLNMGSQRNLMAADLLNRFSVPTQLNQEALSGITGAALMRQWIGENKLRKARTPSNGFFKRILGIR